MKSKEIFDRLVGPVNAKFGAPRGRRDCPPDGIWDFYDENWADFPYFDRIVPLDSGGYDKGGAYWGISSRPLRVRYSKDGQYWQFYR